MLTSTSIRPQARERLLDHPSHLRLHRHVGREPDAVRELRSRLLGALEIRDDDARALAGEPARDRQPDALRAAGDDRHLALETPPLED